MTAKKISQLPDLGAAPAATDELVIVDSGVTKKVSVEDLFTSPSFSGLVGIGTSLPSAKLAIETGIDEGIRIFRTNTNANFGAIEFRNSTDTATNSRIGWNTNELRLEATSIISATTNGVERLRVDASGNLLSGTTVIAVAQGVTTGVSIRGPIGRVEASADGTTSAIFNRLNSDGAVLNLAKDGTTVGSIGARAGYVKIGNGDTNLLFNSAANAITPEDAAANSDGVLDLGRTTSRFKDLYLSGGVYLGGTGAANKLDDYEEGTWTPVISDASTGGNTATYTNNVCTYTKVGRAVHLHINVSTINTTGMTAGNILYIQNLPFVSASTNRYIGSATINNISTTGGVSSNIAGAQAHMRIHDYGTGSDILISAITSGGGLIYSDITYFAT